MRPWKDERARRGAIDIENMKAKRIAINGTVVHFDAGAWSTEELVLAPGAITQACACGEDVLDSGVILLRHTESRDALSCIRCDAIYLASDSDSDAPEPRMTAALSKRDAQDLERLRLRVGGLALMRALADSYRRPAFFTGNRAAAFVRFGNAVESAAEQLLRDLETGTDRRPLT